MNIFKTLFLSRLGITIGDCISFVKRDRLGVDSGCSSKLTISRIFFECDFGVLAIGTLWLSRFNNKLISFRLRP